jgi:hypothetical protein
MNAGDWIALGSLVVSIFALSATVVIWYRQQADERDRRAIVGEQTRMNEALRALRGSKEDIAAQAMHYADHPLPDDPTQRLEVIRSLILAAIFESSGRARALVFTALRSRWGEDDVLILDEISHVQESLLLFKRFGLEDKDFDVSRGTSRLEALVQVLSAGQGAPRVAGPMPSDGVN